MYGHPMFSMYQAAYPVFGCPVPQQPHGFSQQELGRWSAAATPAPTLPCLNNPQGALSVPKMEPQHRPRLLKGRCLDCGRIAQPNAVKCSCHGGVESSAMQRTPSSEKVTALLSRVTSGESFKTALNELQQTVNDSGMALLELGAIIYKFVVGNKEGVEVCTKMCMEVSRWVGDEGGDFKRGLRCVCKEGVTAVVQAAQYRDDSRSECSSSSGCHANLDKQKMSTILDFVTRMFLSGIVEHSLMADCLHQLLEIAEQGGNLALDLLVPLHRVASPELSTRQPYHAQMLLMKKRLEILKDDFVEY